MTRRKNTGDQSIDVGGSYSHSDTLNPSEEPLKLGRIIVGRAGTNAFIISKSGNLVTVTGLLNMSVLSVGRFITISEAASVGNNGTFLIKYFVSPATIKIENSAGVAPDVNNGSIVWQEREPYSLEDDLNYRRTAERTIKGTSSWHDDMPIYFRPTDGLSAVDANLSNISGNTLDAHAWIESRTHKWALVSVGMSYITITDAGNLKHADSVDTIGVPVSDGYDSGNFRSLFVEIVDAEIDGYGDGANLRVLNGVHAGNRIFGQTRAGATLSPDSVEIVFCSMPIDDWSFSSIFPYTWEAGQPNIINICYGFRQRLDRFDEAAIHSILIKGALNGATGGGGGSGLTEATHDALRSLIHFIDEGPASMFVSGAYKEILPSGSPFPSSEIWYTSSAKTDKIVELNITRNEAQAPILEEWNMYDTDGFTISATVIDNIAYNGPFETNRTRTIL